MTEPFPHVAVVLLAAGASRRLSQPKQLLLLEGQPLLERMARAALTCGSGQVVAVLGAFFEKTKPLLNPLPIYVVKNERWETGMGSSISCGVRFVQNKFPATEGILLMLCDQPGVSPALLQHLIKTWHNSGKGIVACTYDETTGVPALFGREFFPELTALAGEKGAKAILQAHPSRVITVPFPEGASDIDTPQDWERFNNNCFPGF